MPGGNSNSRFEMLLSAVVFKAAFQGIRHYASILSLWVNPFSTMAMLLESIFEISIKKCRKLCLKTQISAMALVRVRWVRQTHQFFDVDRAKKTHHTP